MNKLLQKSFLNALATALYIAVVAIVFSNANKIFAQKDNAFTPIAALMLFVLSAAITAGLVVGKPVLMYLDGQKKEAVKMFIYTISWLALGTIILFLTQIKR
jgi:hypothetical protein